MKDVKLLYRVSENDFKASKFHEKCDGVKNTVTLVKRGIFKFLFLNIFRQQIILELVIIIINEKIIIVCVEAVNYIYCSY